MKLEFEPLPVGERTPVDEGNRGLFGEVMPLGRLYESRGDRARRSPPRCVTDRAQARHERSNVVEDIEWVRRCKESPIGSQAGSWSGWELWRRHAQPFPHGEIAPGFRYLICDRPPGGTLDDEQIVTVATVERFMKFTPVNDLEHAR